MKRALPFAYAEGCPEEALESAVNVVAAAALYELPVDVLGSKW